MSLLYADYGVEVHYYDPSDENCSKLQEYAKHLKAEDKIIQQRTTSSYVKA